MVNKKVVLIVTIIAILVVGVIVGIKIKKLDNIDLVISEEKAKENYDDDNFYNEVNDENIIENKINNDVIENEENENNENINKDNNFEENTIDSNSSNNDDKVLSGEEKAKNLAKEKWQNQKTNVYYYVDSKLSDDEYVVSVRDNDTTISLIDYKINIKTGEIEEY